MIHQNHLCVISATSQGNWCYSKFSHLTDFLTLCSSVLNKGTSLMYIVMSYIVLPSSAREAMARINFLIKEANGLHLLPFYLYFHFMSSSSFKCKTKSCVGYTGYILHETNSNAPITHIFLEFEKGTSICITIFRLSNLICNLVI